MDTVTISKQTYNRLKRDAAAWRAAHGGDEMVIFNADRDNNGKGVPVEEFIEVLERLERNGK